MPSMTLTYDAANERLIGNVGDEWFNMHAVSGGGRGSTVTPRGNRLARDYDYRTPEPKPQGPGLAGGGPLPPGFYICHFLAHHPPFGACISLTPVKFPNVSFTPPYVTMKTLSGSTRDAFYIHGHGPKGSAGCIVPDSPGERMRLNRAIKAHPGTVLHSVNPWRTLPPNRTSERS